MSPKESDRAVEPRIGVAGDGGVNQIHLRCPRCGAAGRIEWSALGRAIGCHRCACRFVVLRSGRAVPMEDFPQVPYTCPRCRTSATIPAPVATNAPACPRCQLPLSFGPDKRLYGLDDAARLRRDAHKCGAERQDGLRRSSHDVGQYGRWNRPSAVAILAVCCGLVTAAVIGMRLFVDPSPERLAARLCRICLAGDTLAAESYLEDDAVQRVEFERWQLLYLGSLRDSYRPAGDRVSIFVSTREASDDTKALQVALTSKFIGTRYIPMNWSLRDGRWVFDAHGTLTERLSAPVQTSTPSNRHASS